ncbi:hypothetical protein ABZ370_31260 [Streptomyces sp. NPDC005962]|uniref:hypothetical protein n=1 Tax=Streptomyces sp. NPDC005962 TaxID=3154466 RepID=UPI0033E3E58D
MPRSDEGLAPAADLQTAVPIGGTARRGSNAARLRSMRLAIYADVMRGITSPPVRVAEYALVRPGQDPADRLAQTRALVVRESWQMVMTTYDDTGMTDPATRPHLARLYAAIRRRELHGIVAASRTDITTFHDIYEDTLTRIRTCGGFLVLAHDETTQ